MRLSNLESINTLRNYCTTQNPSIFFVKHSVLLSTQYGFRSNYSFEHAVTNIVSTRFENIDYNLYTELVTLDFYKAFHSITQSALFRKLKQLWHSR